MLCLIVIGSVLLSAAAVAEEKPAAPPLPATVTTLKDYPTLQNASFTGKVTLVMFDQEMDQKGNVLRYDLFGKLKDVVPADYRLLAVVVGAGDGGFARDRCPADRWVVVTDPGMAWRTALGVAGDIPYAVIDPAGRLVETGDTLKHKRLPVGRSFFFLEKDFLALYGAEARSVLPHERNYGSTLDKARRYIELRDFRPALDELRTNQDAGMARKMFEDLGELILVDVAAQCEKLGVLDGKDAPTSSHYLAWKELASLAEDLGKSDAGQLAAKTVGHYASRMKPEIAAEEAFGKLMEQMVKASEEQRRNHGAKAWMTLAKRYPDTFYGGLMLQEAAKLEALGPMPKEP